MNIAKIVSSNSHVEYIARVVDALDVAEPPAESDYGFGRFVFIEMNEGDGLAGIVYNSMLMNPDYANFGPRLSPKPQLENFSPDFLNEQGCLLAILVLGRLGSSDISKHGIPSPVVPAGQDVRALSEHEIRKFHTDDAGRVSLNYYSHVMTHAGAFAVPLLENIISQLNAMEGCSAEDLKKLSVLRRNLVWQRTVGQTRL